MKKKFLLSILFLFFLLSNIPFGMVYAQETVLTDEYELLCLTNDQILYEFEECETDVASELNTWKAELLEINTNDSIELMGNVDYLLTQYNNLNSQSTNARTGAIGIVIDSMYRSIIISAIAFFYMMQYKFSAECLGKAYLNSNDNLVYYDILFHSSTYAEMYNGIIEGENPTSCNFEPGANPIENDCYLAIHSCDIIYESEKIYIHDFYDFDGNLSFTSIMDNLLLIFENAVERGIITPYHIFIEIVEPHTTLCTPSSLGHIYNCNNSSCHLQIHEVNHNYENKYSISHHYEECVNCGIQKNNEAHVFDYRSISSTQHIVECSICKYSFYEEHKFVMMPAVPFAQIISKKACEKCGHIFM